MELAKEDAKEIVRAGKEKVADMMEWIGTKSDDNLDAIMGKENMSMLTLILTDLDMRYPLAAPTLMKEHAILGKTCFFAGYRKGLEVGALNAVYNKEGG